ncbi:hypothetical protein CDD83_2033 [Cordyceps sp. RAO-2017]|nr:hypothetical protein CDD83_2033 [Cordyceps sp. RAO-2017]
MHAGHSCACPSNWPSIIRSRKGAALRRLSRPPPYSTKILISGVQRVHRWHLGPLLLRGTLAISTYHPFYLPGDAPHICFTVRFIRTGEQSIAFLAGHGKPQAIEKYLQRSSAARSTSAPSPFFLFPAYQQHYPSSLHNPSLPGPFPSRCCNPPTLASAASSPPNARYRPLGPWPAEKSSHRKAMTTATRQQQQQPQSFPAADTFDPDEVVPRDSPLMQALRPKLELSPSPTPDIPPAQIRPSSGDAVLVSYLDNGRHPDIARAAGAQALPGVDDDGDGDAGPRPGSSNTGPCTAVCGPDGSQTPHRAITTPILQNMAADALQAVSAETPSIPPLRETPDISASTRQLSISDGRSCKSTTYSSSTHTSRPSVQLKTGAKSPTPALTPACGELPPLQMVSPKSESNGQSLPSIRSTFGDIKHIPSELRTPADTDLTPMSGATAAFSRSPSGARPRLPLMSATHVSPPISPSEAYQRSLPSPHSLPASSPFGFYQTNGLGQRPNTEFIGTATAETPSTDQSASTPATSASVADRMSIDGLTNPQVGVYVCNFSGCSAPPFQTQYLLNSHANVHSSARPHYCPVKGCPRSEGGKGFKRKNEMIRHGLVHDSPGYVCPFCPDREHKYPRPDNLQRHVRVHHVDKDKDDPLLREVLSQRPDGPSRGRRRRGVAA